MEFGGQILSYHKFKGAVFAAQKVDKALYLEIDLNLRRKNKAERTGRP